MKLSAVTTPVSLPDLAAAFQAAGMPAGAIPLACSHACLETRREWAWIRRTYGAR